MKVVLGGRTVSSPRGARGASVRSDRVTVDLTQGKGGRLIAAAMKNEIQADIRAITAPASEATMIKRAAMRGDRGASAIAGLAETIFDESASGVSGGPGKRGRRKRARKHLGKGTFANDTGRLADKLRVQWSSESPTRERYDTNAPPDRLDPAVFGVRYGAFRARLIALCPTLRDAAVLWARPRVQAAIKRAIEMMTTVERGRSVTGGFR